MNNTISNPCVRNCTLDKDDICVGCYRSLSEILDWHSMDKVKRQHTLQRCDQRREQKKPA